MKAFSCPSCSQVVYFENTVCEQCHHALGYLPALNTMTSVCAEGAAWRAASDPDRLYRFCANWEREACNWLVPVDDGEGSHMCEACQHNRAIPDLTDPHRLLLWKRIEEAKRRLFYSLLKLRLPRPTIAGGAPEPLVFDFLADSTDAPKVMTGHDNGVITIALDEADGVHREHMRSSLNEHYRTLLGHFRHEVGHFYWDVLVRDGGNLEACRAVFGDERADYDEALKTYYASGAKPDWQTYAISAYATSHPWEDFAETWSHYLHIVDTLEMAYSFGLSVDSRVADDGQLTAKVRRNPYEFTDGDTLLAAWRPISIAVNNLNRTMGLPDLYPFVISPAVVGKLTFIIQLVKNHRALSDPAVQPKPPLGAAAAPAHAA